MAPIKHQPHQDWNNWGNNLSKICLQPVEVTPTRDQTNLLGGFYNCHLLDKAGVALKTICSSSHPRNLTDRTRGCVELLSRCQKSNWSTCCGLPGQERLENSLWWNGPEFLKNPDSTRAKSPQVQTGNEEAMIKLVKCPRVFNSRVG